MMMAVDEHDDEFKMAKGAANHHLLVSSTSDVAADD